MLEVFISNGNNNICVVAYQLNSFNGLGTWANLTLETNETSLFRAGNYLVGNNKINLSDLGVESSGFSFYPNTRFDLCQLTDGGVVGINNSGQELKNGICCRRDFNCR